MIFSCCDERSFVQRYFLHILYEEYFLQSQLLHMQVKDCCTLGRFRVYTLRSVTSALSCRRSRTYDEACSSFIFVRTQPFV